MALGVESVEHDAVDCDGGGLNDNLDDGADQTPVLQTADEFVRDFVLEEALSGVVHARPSPHILVVRVRLCTLQDARSYAPHDYAEDEEADGEGRVVDSGFLGSIVSSFPVRVEDDDAHEE